MDAGTKPGRLRYGTVAVVLHWLVAVAIAVNLGLGWWMSDAIDSASGQAAAIAGFALHKSLGLSILVLALLRLAWRARVSPPAWPVTMPLWERRAAAWAHRLLYGLMLAVPVSGWFYVSTQWRGEAPLQVPTLWFGQIVVPHLFDATRLSAPLRAQLAQGALLAHLGFIYVLLGLLLVHVVAALRHHFVKRDEVLRRMMPWLTAARAGSRSRVQALGMLAVVIGLGSGSALLVLFALQPAGAPDEVTLESLSEAEPPETGWLIDRSRSRIGFRGEHAGRPFAGHFTRWSGRIEWSGDAPQLAKITATIDTGSATDGVPLHDRTLAEPEWFDVARFPTARFTSTRLVQGAAGGYQLEGVLRIKDRQLTVAPLQLSVDDTSLSIIGEVSVDRADADLGMASDPAGDYVSRHIDIEVRVHAEFKP